jgi:hypothetical protein
MPTFCSAAPLLFLSLLLLAGCRSPEELYAEGQRLELDGRPASAAYYYADALDENPGLQKAQGRLRVAGAAAVALYLEDAAAALDRDHLADAADRYLYADRLIRRAAVVGITLDRPADYLDARRATLDAAFDAAPDEARRLARAGLFGDAVAHLDRARRYVDGTRGIDQLAGARGDVLALWAETDLAMGRYRAAFDRAESGRAVLDGVPADIAGALASRLLGIQEEALARGTVRAAVFPVEAREGVLPSRSAFADFDRDLTDRLYDGPLAAAPVFLQYAAPPAVRAALRDVRGEDLFGRPGLSATLARRLEAEYGVAFRLDTLTVEGDQPVPSRPGAGSEPADRVEVAATLAYAVTDARTARVVCDGLIDQAERERIRRGDAADARRVALLRLQDHLAEEVGERVAACLFARVP